MKAFKILFVLTLLCINSTLIKAQDTMEKEPMILISGEVSCVDPLNGNLSSVMVYNISQGFGAITNQDGSFAIKMARNDTLMFSTAEHRDYYYLIEDDSDFKDHSIEVIMVTDAIWLEAVTIMGQKSLEEFKREILSMDIPQGNTELVLPVVNKYAKQLSTGAGETDLVGPLTYLHHKFDRYYKMRKRVEMAGSSHDKK